MVHGKARSQRYQLLKRVENLFELPMIILGFVWLALLIIELVYKTSPVLETFGLVIWIIFIVDFLIKFSIAPEKIRFLRKNILTVISLIVPAFRVLRIARVLRLLRLSRGLRLVKVIGSLNRSNGEDVEQLRTEVGLSEEQLKKIKDINAIMTTAFQKTPGRYNDDRRLSTSRCEDDSG